MGKGNADDRLNSEIERIRTQFLAGLPEQVTQLEAAVAGLDGSHGAARLDALRCASATAHALAGSAGSFGYPALGAAAAALESSLNAAADDRGSNPAGGAHAELLQRFVLCAQHAVDGLPSVVVSESRPSRPYERAGTVVIIEDDPALSMRLTNYLHHFGYEIRHFADATRFCAAAPTLGRPTALLIDNALPEGALAGIQAALSRPDAMAGTPIIFMSVNDSQEARIAALHAGGRAYLHKPVEPAEVLDTLEAIAETRQSRPIRVLVVDDEASMVDYHRAVLEAAGFDTVGLTDPADFLECMREQQPDLVLLDLHMPGYSGADLAAMIHQIAPFAGIPVLFVSAEHDTDTQDAAMLSGGDDFLTKPISAERLVTAVRYRATRHRQLRNLMKNDSLTGLLNHASIKSRLASETNRIVRHGGSLAVGMIDIDHFKQVNDTFGHANGDRILRELAMLLRRRLRSSDTAGRYGGEEFVVLLPNTSLDAAVGLLDAIRDDFSQVSHFVGARELRVSFSGGVATLDNWPSSEAVLMAADAALYAAKKAGRNQIHKARPHPAAANGGQ